jgi:hypothetical protein
MATPATTAAALAQNRHQGGLREYVNQKLAPYVKKALKDVCDVEYAEYPMFPSCQLPLTYTPQRRIPPPMARRTPHQSVPPLRKQP